MTRAQLDIYNKLTNLNDVNENTIEEKKTLAEIAADHKPKTFDVEDIALPDSLQALTESIAENTHDCWAKARMSQG